METKWLEDFVSLAETHSFSRSAHLRHVTQSAFSRRIQSLESWVGTDLIDRSAYPTRLTAAGQALYPQALQILQSVQTARSSLRQYSDAAQDVIEFAVPHTLAFTFFPAWVSVLRADFGAIKSRLMALNVHDAMMRLVEGSCDIVIAYHHASQPNPLELERYDMVLLGKETLAPYVKPDSHGLPLYPLPGKPTQPVPFLDYAPGAYLGQMVEYLLKDDNPPMHLDRVYETDMAEGLRVMALEGHGVAFLPHSAVRHDLAEHKLVSALPAYLSHLCTTMEIRAYRQHPSAAMAQHNTKALALWDYLLAHANNRP
jgi:DNA-binding transcriptional LysR family regulator